MRRSYIALSTSGETLPMALIDCKFFSETPGMCYQCCGTEDFLYTQNTRFRVPKEGPKSVFFSAKRSSSSLSEREGSFFRRFLMLQTSASFEVRQAARASCGLYFDKKPAACHKAGVRRSAGNASGGAMAQIICWLPIGGRRCLRWYRGIFGGMASR